MSFNTHVYSKATIPKVTKFTYLQSLIKGEAKKVIANLSLDEDTYDIAIQLLKVNYYTKQIV